MPTGARLPASRVGSAIASSSSTQPVRVVVEVTRGSKRAPHTPEASNLIIDSVLYVWCGGARRRLHQHVRQWQR